MKHTRILALGALVAAAPFVANAGAFLPYKKIPVPGYPVSTAVGDVTGDGLDDVVVATTTSGTYDAANDYSLFVFVQKPSGMLAAAIKVADKATWFFQGGLNLAVSDLDHDGIQDVVVAHAGGITTFGGNREASFRATDVATPGIASSSDERTVAVFDVNRDGHPDVLTEYWELGEDPYNDEVLRAYLNDGTGTFPTQVGIETPGYSIVGAHALRTGDLNHDGRTDFATFGGSIYNAYMFLQGEPSGFLPVRFRYAARLEIGDFNADGMDDIAYWTDSSSPYLTVSAQQSDGQFNPVQSLLGVENPSATIAADIDGDGRQDLVALNPYHATLAFYRQGDSGLEAASQFALPVASAVSPTALATGDVNNDNCRDVVMVHPDHGLVLLQGNACVRHATGKRRDLDGDGRSDIVWRNTSTGANAAWKAGNSLAPLPVMGVTNTAWTIVGIDDFDGDGHADILWRDMVTGANAAWRAGDYSSQLSLTRVTDPAWRVAGTGDFDFDGHADILWHNVRTGANGIWRSADYRSQFPVTGVSNLDWAIAGTGDFDGDGHADILWHNARTGANGIWRSADYRSQFPVTGVTNVDWKIAGIGDFDGDGHADILWRNTRTGANAVWRSADYRTQFAVTTLADTAWSVADTGDYDGDGRADILWRNTRTGENSIWRSADARQVQPVTAVTNTVWTVKN